MHSGDRLREIAKELRYRPVDLANLLNESSQTINAWFKRGVPHAKIKRVAKKLEINPAWLSDNEGLKYNSVREEGGIYATHKGIPIVGNAQAGPDGYWDDMGHLEHGDGFIVASSKDPDAYALRVRGDSMAPAIKNGWIVVIEPNSPVQQGEYAMVCTTDGLCMIKELRYEHDDEYTLGSINENHPAMTVQKINVMRLHPVTLIVPPSMRQV
jgi:phage repressor protein C with HTH and peptisase S24 domain